MAAQCAEPESVVDSTAQRVDASVLIMGRIGLLVGFARHGIDSPECRSIPTAQKNAPERLVEVETSHCNWEAQKLACRRPGVRRLSPRCGGSRFELARLRRGEAWMGVWLLRLISGFILFRYVLTLARL